LLTVMGSMVIACSSGHDERRNETSARAGADVQSSNAETNTAAGQAGARVTWHATRSYDLTGDGTPEQLDVSARGPSYDSLDIVLTIRQGDGKVLYVDRWNANRYFFYDHREGKADSTVQRIVMNHLQRLLRDSAFAAPPLAGHQAEVDTNTVRYDIAEHEVRARNGLADTVMFPPTFYDSVEHVVQTIPTTQIERVAQDVRNKPRFTYFAGGEVTSRLAWSSILGRFVRVFSCC
jgi:hypothetical protein